ncbi:hypothetical protein Lfu02_40480 [Longispora fulva]|uniref:C-terminal processing protease CtpA/Prc n=1 Tax=Longispora fulva TaxID=619741 RepID=A0A8J7GGX3_9ACTN|nr:S41 family peptidase [Longispora fulva]MBG6136507.1 C-terminal processing protease CtpA/Prc [Longispora fulva]GIG59676.1 hypothetical protein Lfu02_40480 [Longispora fulva]
MTPQEVVTELADKIEKLYVFPEEAKRIADELRSRPLTARTPEALVAELQPYLRAQDGHLGLVWLPDSATADRRARPNLMDPAYQIRINHGLRQAGLVEDGIGLIDFSMIGDGDVAAMREAARAATVMVASADAVVLDLRDVPGGWPSGVNMLLGHFLAAEPTHLLTMTSRTAPDQLDWSPADNPLGHRPDVPVFIAVDARTASAGEAFAYNAQSLGRATIIGQRTAGAANPGDFFPIGDEFKAFIPTEAPIDPRTGTNWEGVGVQPDVLVESDEALRTAIALARAAVAG